MRTHKSGILGLALVTAVLAACEQKTPIVNVEVPVDSQSQPVTVEIVPGALSLNVGQTRQLTAVVQGSTNQAVTWSSDNQAVATVSASGVVEAKAVGAATISAVSSADARGRDAIEVVVTQGGGEGGATSITIQSVTQGATLFPVAINNVQGQIDITANVDIPAGSGAQSVKFFIDDTEVCVQEFSNGTGESADASVPVPVICSVNTAAYDSTANGLVPQFLNGVHTVSASIVGPTGTETAQTTKQQYVFNNLNFINTDIQYGNGCAFSGNDAVSANPVPSVAPAGSVWCGGSVTVTARPVIFNRQAATGDTAFTSQAVKNVTVSMITAGIGANGDYDADGDLTDCDPVNGGNLPNCAPFTVTLTDATISNGAFQVVFNGTTSVNAATPGAAGIEDQVQFRIMSQTIGGQPGPTCINPDFTTNTHNTGRLNANFCGANGFGLNAPGTASAPNQVYRANPDYLDNLAPRATFFTLPGYTQGDQTRARYVNAAFDFTAAGTTTANAIVRGTGVIQNDVDYGVDRQNENITTCPADGRACSFFSVELQDGSTHRIATGADIDAVTTESETNNVLKVSATLVDALGNSATYFPTTTAPLGSVVTTNGNAAAVALVGLDVTAPTMTATHSDNACAGNTTPTANCVYPDAGGNPPTDTWIYTFQDLAGDAGSGPSGFFASPVRVWMTRTAAGATSNVLGTPNGFVQDLDGVVPVTNASNIDGYYRTRAWVNDAAANQSNTTNALVLLDATAPSMGGIGSSSSIVGFTNVSFTADLSDNVELGDLGVYIGYGVSGYELLHQPQGTVNSQNRLQIGEYGDDATPATSSAPVTVVRFIRSIETTNADGSASGTVTQATDVNYLLRDVAGFTVGDACPAPGAADNTATLNCRLRSLNITANVAQGNNNLAFPTFATLTFPSDNAFAMAGLGQFLTRGNTNPWTAPAANQNVCNRPAGATGCTNPRTVTLTATVNGPQASFAQPFAEIRFYYHDASGREILIGTATTTTSIDDDVLAERRWVYQTTWTPTNVPVGNYNWFAVGVHSSGSALVTQDAAGTVNVLAN